MVHEGAKRGVAAGNLRRLEGKAGELPGPGNTATSCGRDRSCAFIPRRSPGAAKGVT
jgi:hypothetical protein